MDQLTHKFVAILNKKIPTPNLMNALGHMAAGIVGKYPDLSVMRFDDYFDKDDSIHKSISDYPFIILQADNSNKIRAARNQALENNIYFVDFISTMAAGTFAEQQEVTKKTPEAELEYYGICLFGPKDELSALTKKFSLWK